MINIQYMNLGQVYTKNDVADFMVSLLDLPHNAFIVDPCFGRGVFVNSLLKANYSNITGIEIDSETFSNIENPAETKCNLIREDFFSFKPQVPVDGFILNPPYVRQEEIDDMEMLGVTKDIIQAKCGDFTIYSKANLYIYFIARCVHLLRNGGQMVAIFPNAWINTPDGKGFMSQLLGKGSIDNLIKVVGYPFVGNPFVDVIILKFTKGGDNKTREETLIIRDNTINLEPTNSDLKTVDVSNCVPLSTIASIRRGITTGYNKAFINPQIDDKSIQIKILSTPKDVPGYSTRYARCDNLLKIDNGMTISEDLACYIKEYERMILSQGKPKSLMEEIKKGKEWYSLTIPNPSDIVFPYIIRNNVRFILNDGKVVVRDNFYSISSNHDSMLLMALLNNLFVFSQLELMGKSYGNGILKIQKYDVDNIVVPNPETLKCNLQVSTQLFSEKLQ